ncbi:MAG: hypothetical protein HRT36_06325 [Alphaproteobacteria bacterium]|nr:hypothetical protein [Alphaproteobacteria bacterium]
MLANPSNPSARGRCNANRIATKTRKDRGELKIGLELLVRGYSARLIAYIHNAEYALRYTSAYLTR